MYQDQTPLYVWIALTVLCISAAVFALAFAITMIKDWKDRRP